jgi:hypothetical protein
MSDLSQIFQAADILGVPQTIKGFGKSDFYEVLINLNPANLNLIYKIQKFHIASSHPTKFHPF